MKQYELWRINELVRNKGRTRSRDITKHVNTNKLWKGRINIFLEMFLNSIANVLRHCVIVVVKDFLTPGLTRCNSQVAADSSSAFRCLTTLWRILPISVFYFSLRNRKPRSLLSWNHKHELPINDAVPASELKFNWSHKAIVVIVNLPEINYNI